MKTTIYTTMNDLITCNKNLKCAPITDALGFLMAVANTYALAQVLFMHTSPLTIGLQGLLTIMICGHHNDKLYNIGQYQRDWYAHGLWTAYDICTKSLDQCLTEADILGHDWQIHSWPSTMKSPVFYPMKTWAVHPASTNQPHPGHQQAMPHHWHTNSLQPMQQEAVEAEMLEAVDDKN